MGAEPQSLADVALLRDLPPDELARVEKLCRWKSYAAHEQIIDRQSESRDVYFVISGAVRVILYSLSGREITLDDLQEGSHFGDLAALDGQPRSASVMALTACQMAALPPEHFLELLDKSPRIARRLMVSLVHLLRQSTDRIMDLSTLGANNRVHADLLRQARAVMTFDNTAEIRPIPVHGDIASRVSTTRETVARVMNDLARKGIIERQKDALVIKDIERLEDMVEEVRGE